MTVLPGPSAVTTALVISGLPTDRFVHVQVSRPGGPASGRAGSPSCGRWRRTLVLFESRPAKLAATLAELRAGAFGPDRRHAVYQELTRDPRGGQPRNPGRAGRQSQRGARWEITLVIEGALDPRAGAVPMDVALAQVAEQVAVEPARGGTRSAAVASEARAVWRAVYNAAVSTRPD